MQVLLNYKTVTNISGVKIENCGSNINLRLSISLNTLARWMNMERYMYLFYVRVLVYIGSPWSGVGGSIVNNPWDLIREQRSFNEVGVFWQVSHGTPGKRGLCSLGQQNDQHFTPWLKLATRNEYFPSYFTFLLIPTPDRNPTKLSYPNRKEDLNRPFQLPGHKQRITSAL